MKRRRFIRNFSWGMGSGLIGSCFFHPARSRGQQGLSAKSRVPIKKSMYWGMMPEGFSVSEKFELAKRIGLDGLEIPTLERTEDVDEFKEAAGKTGVVIHSIMNQKHWKYPLSSSNPSDIKISMQGMETSLYLARDLGADTVLLVPAVVNPETSYRDAYERSRKQVKELVALAEELQIVIGVENVWNKFLLSPLEFARYVDEFDSPYLKAYFDVGNIVLYGYPQDWIRTLGSRIVKIHVKGFDAKKMSFCNLGDGTIDWPEVRRALGEIDYSGFIGAELKGGDEAYLLDVSTRLDKIIAGTL